MSITKEDKLDKIERTLADLEWSDPNIETIMSDFFNSPLDAVEHLLNTCTEEHVDSLFEDLECEEGEE